MCYNCYHRIQQQTQLSDWNQQKQKALFVFITKVWNVIFLITMSLTQNKKLCDVDIYYNLVCHTKKRMHHDSKRILTTTTKQKQQQLHYLFIYSR
jgi:hypothetical protein